MHIYIDVCVRTHMYTHRSMCVYVCNLSLAAAFLETARAQAEEMLNALPGFELMGENMPLGAE